MNFNLMRPANIRNKQLRNNKAAVEKLAGNIKPQIIKNAAINFINRKFHLEFTSKLIKKVFVMNRIISYFD